MYHYGHQALPTISVGALGLWAYAAATKRRAPDQPCQLCVLAGATTVRMVPLHLLCHGAEQQRALPPRGRRPGRWRRDDRRRESAGGLVGSHASVPGDVPARGGHLGGYCDFCGLERWMNRAGLGHLCGAGSMSGGKELNYQKLKRLEVFTY